MEQVELDGDRILKMDNMHFPEAVGKAVGVAKFSPSLVDWALKRIEGYIEEGDKNQNYYGILRQAVRHFDVYVTPRLGNLLEVNTVEDLFFASQPFCR